MSDSKKLPDDQIENPSLKAELIPRAHSTHGTPTSNLSAETPLPLRLTDYGTRSLPQGTETLLVVDDDHGVIGFIKFTLEGCGYKVLDAKNGPQAIERALKHSERIHLLVTDVVMPRMNGREVAKQVELLRPGIRVLYISGFLDDAELRDSINDAQHYFLPKPFAPIDLATKVRQVLDAK